MLRSLKDIEGYRISTRDGDIGRVSDLLLDDQRWVVRYLVVQTTGLFFQDDRQVLISLIFSRQVEWATGHFYLALSSEKVNNSPNVDVHKPVSRQQEHDYCTYYGCPRYWEYSGMWGRGMYPVGLTRGQWNEGAAERTRNSRGDSHLRSQQEIRGYHIRGKDEAIGHVRDFIVDDETWKVHYLVVDTSNWWFGQCVLIAPHWAHHISWLERKVFVDLSRQQIRDSPEWDPGMAVNREYETRLHDYYGQPADWSPSGQARDAEPGLR